MHTVGLEFAVKGSEPRVGAALACGAKGSVVKSRVSDGRPVC